MGASTVTAILGPSGVGKSTLLGAIAGYISPSEGAIDIEEHAAIAWAQQSSPVLPRRSVLDNVALGAECQGMPESAARARAATSLDAVGLGTMLGVRAGRLSGGERQRVALARALASNAGIILVDEPTASLDIASRDVVVEAIGAAARWGSCLVVATHDRYVAEAADSVVDLVEHAYRGEAT